MHNEYLLLNDESNSLSLAMLEGLEEERTLFQKIWHGNNFLYLLIFDL